jgi:hypothetical protein
MEGEQDRASLGLELGHLGQALALERAIPDRQHLIHQQHVGIGVDGHREEVDVVPRGELTVEPGVQLEQRRDATRTGTARLVGATMPPSTRRSVDLPAPLAPISPTVSPWATCRRTSRGPTAPGHPARAAHPEAAWLQGAFACGEPLAHVPSDDGRLRVRRSPPAARYCDHFPPSGVPRAGGPVNWAANTWRSLAGRQGRIRSRLPVR